MYSKLTDYRPTYAVSDHDLFLWSLYTTRACVCVVILFVLRSGRACRLRRGLFERADHAWILCEVLLCAQPPPLLVAEAHRRESLWTAAACALTFLPVPLFVTTAERGNGTACACCVLFALLQRSAMAAQGRLIYGLLFLLAFRPLWIGAAVYTEDAKVHRENKGKRMFIV